MDAAEIDDVGRIVEFAPNVIYVYDQVQHKNAYANRSVGESLGYSPEQIQLLGADLMPTLIHPDDLQHVFTHFSKIRHLGDDDVATLEYRIKHNDGHWVWMLSHDTVFRRDASGKVTHHIGSASDITPQKHAEAVALAAQAKEAVTNEELKEFAYAISHDMKAPSNTMKLILSELENELSCKNDSTEGLLVLANTTINRMQRLVDDVLHFTQIIGQDIRYQKLDLNVLLGEITHLLKADITGFGAAITIDPLPCVKGSETQLMILFQNLLLNAMKFSRPGVAPVVHIEFRLGNTQNSAVISVCDNGIGIAEERFDQIFKMFKKLNSNPRHEGTGLGLAICRRIALNHGSEIAIVSEVGKGSKFSIELELA